MVEPRVTSAQRQSASAPPPHRARDGRESVVVYALAAAALAGVALALGKDVNWDLQNYHDYAPWALLHGGYARDVLAGNWQAYLNPIVFLVRYPLVTALPPRAASAALAAVQALNVPLVYLIAARLLSRERRGARIALAGLAATIGGLSALFLSQIGTSFADVLISIPTLAAVLLMLPRAGDDHARARRRIALAGLAMGLSVGLKLTNYYFALALALAVAIGWPSWRARLRALVALGAGGAAGAVATALPWALRMQREFGNPLFPLFGHGETIITDARDVRFQPTGVLHALTYPWRWAAGVAVTTEIPFTDVRVLLLLGLVALTALVVAMRWRPAASDLGARRLGAFLASGTVFWLLSSGLHRHAMALDLLVGPAIVLCCRRLLPARRAIVAGAALAAVALVTVRPPDWGRQRWTRTWFDVRGTAALPPAPTVVLIPRSGSPLGFLPERFPAGSTFVQCGFAAFVPPGSVLDRRARAILAAAPADRTFVVVDAPPDDEARRVVQGLGFALTVPCLPIHTSLREMAACPLERAGAAAEPPLLRADAWSSPGWPGDGAALLGDGWSVSEPWGRWAVGSHSTLRFVPARRAPGPSVVEMVGHGFVGDALPPLTVDVAVDGRHATTWRFAGDVDRAETTRTVCLPDGADGRVTIELRADAPRSPASVGQSGDQRPLTFGLRRLRLRPAAAGECA